MLLVRECDCEGCVGGRVNVYFLFWSCEDQCVCVCVFGMVVLRVVDVIRICVSSMVTRRYV